MQVKVGEFEAINKFMDIFMKRQMLREYFTEDEYQKMCDAFEAMRSIIARHESDNAKVAMRIANKRKTNKHYAR